jgi:hypothetical protein
MDVVRLDEGFEILVGQESDPVAAADEAEGKGDERLGVAAGADGDEGVEHGGEGRKGGGWGGYEKGIGSIEGRRGRAGAGGAGEAPCLNSGCIAACNWTRTKESM